MAYTGPDLSSLLDYGLNQGTPITQLGQKENDLLNLVRQLDPNASWKWQDNSGSSNEGGTQAASNYVLDFDHTKLPTALPGSPEHQQGTDLRGIMGSSGEVFGMTSLKDPESYASNNLLHPEYQWDTPYGRMTDTRNVRQDTSAMDTVFKFAPMLILSLATLGGGGSLLGGLSSALNASGASGFQSLLGSSLPGLLQSGANGNFNFGSLAGMLGSMAGLPSWMRPLISTGTNALINGRKGP